MSTRLFSPQGLPLLVSSATSPVQFTDDLVEGVILAINNTTTLGNITITNFADTLKNNVVPILPNKNEFIAFGLPQNSIKVTGTQILVQPGLMNKKEGLIESPVYFSPFLWQDPSDLSILFQERTGASATTPAIINGPVGTMQDKGSLGLFWTAPSDAARPILRNSNNLYWLDFDGIVSELSTTVTINQPLDYVNAWRISSDDASGTLFGSAGPLQAYYAGGTLRLFSGAELIGPAVPGTGVDFILSNRFNGVSSRIAQDNNAYVTGDAGAAGIAGTYSIANGGIGFATVRYYGGTACGLLKDSNINDLRNYYASKQGRTL